MPEMNTELLNFFESLNQAHALQVAELQKVIDTQNESIRDMQATISRLEETVRILTEKLNKNSKNSSKPPSSDGLKKPAPKSLRGKTNKKQGGQDGHHGTNLPKMVPDRVIRCMPSKCDHCPKREECEKAAQVLEQRQVVDVITTTEVTAYNKMRVTNCPLHGWTRDGDFPSQIKAPVQYGDNLQALVVSFNTIGAVSITRIHEILSGIFNVPLSTGTISSMIERCADSLHDVLDRIGKCVIQQPVLHADETGFRVDKKLNWAHVLCNEQYTLIRLHPKRGWEAMEEIGILPLFHGILQHDCWGPYWKHPDATHAVCCAHLLRELTGIEENNPKLTWPKAFKKLLLKMKKARDRAFGKDKSELSNYYQKKFSSEYDNIITAAYQETPVPEQKPGKRGRKKRGKLLALIDRLSMYKASVCLFIKDFAVDFDNNQAERDLRMTKAKLKIAGCFRTRKGADDYLGIMSYVYTARKQGHNAYEAILQAVKGTPEFIFE
jgi:transposase